MTFPNFLIIGAAKAGTTSLHQYLRQHPQIFLPPNKEPGFFAYQDSPPRLTGPGDPAEREYLTLDLPAYQQLFANAAPFPARGEASTAYLYHPHTAEAIRQILPTGKLIAILRHPVDRAYSSYLQLVRDGREPRPDFQAALLAEPERIDAGWGQIWHYRQMGYYGRQLRPYFACFPRHQIQVFLYEEFQTHPEQVLHKIFNFLEVETTFSPETSTQLNVSGVPQNQTLYGVLTRHRPLRNLLRHLMPYPLRKYLNHQLTRWPLTKPPIPAEIRKELMADFRPDLLDLQTLLNQDLSSWLTP